LKELKMAGHLAGEMVALWADQLVVQKDAWSGDVRDMR
jgi:hypothetical protein